MDLSFSGQLLRVFFFNFLRAKKLNFFWKHCRKFPHFLVILMTLFTAEPLRFFIYISVCCWTFELSLLLNLWDYLLLLNLWIFFTAEPLRLCPGLCICLLLNLWDYLFASEPLDFLYCWTFEIMPWIMYLFDAEALRTFSSKQNHQKSKWTLNKTSWIRNYRYFYHPCKDLKKIKYIYYITLGTLTINMLCRRVLKMTHFQLIAWFGQTLLGR